MSGSEEIDYDNDDFEDASDDDIGGRLSRSGTSFADTRRGSKSLADAARSADAGSSTIVAANVDAAPSASAAAAPAKAVDQDVATVSPPSASGRRRPRPADVSSNNGTAAPVLPTPSGPPPLPKPSSAGAVETPSGRPSSHASSRAGSRGGTNISIGNVSRLEAEDGSPGLSPGLQRLPDAMQQLPLERGGSSGSSGGRRLVRGKISLSSQGDDLGGESRGAGRPGTGDSMGTDQQRGSSAGGSGIGNPSSKPLWLQHDESALAARHRDPFGGDLARSSGSGGRPRSAAGVGNSSSSRGAGTGSFAFGDNPQRSKAGELHSGVFGGGRRPRHSDDDADTDSRLGAAAGDKESDRKAKRLQGEIQRLTQRLAEAELYSSQDDGLPRFALEDVEIGHQIAQGGFSSVHVASWHETRCALKKIFDPVITEELRAEFENEVRMLRRMRHPNIVTIMAVCRVPPALSILTELVVGGSLFDLLHGPPVSASMARNRPLVEPAVLMPLVQESGTAIAYLHAMLVVHRDVKSQNVLLTEGRRPIAKLCDFGLARMKSELCTGTMQWAGTAAYMAPELFSKKRYNEMVDVFAFGVMIWEVASTELPHANLDVEDIAHRVKSKDGAGLAVSHSWSKPLKALLKKTLAVQATDRPSMSTVVRELGIVIQELPMPED